MPKAGPFDDRRSHPRYDVQFRTVFIESEVMGEHIEIVNIARLGLLAKCRNPRDTGTEIELELPNIGLVKATVVWSANGLMGSIFQDPIDEQDFTEFLESLA